MSQLWVQQSLSPKLERAERLQNHHCLEQRRYVIPRVEGSAVGDL